MSNNNLISRVVEWGSKRSLWTFRFFSGNCRGCDMEFASCFTPKYDIERLGVAIKDDPIHADVLVCTGPATLHSAQQLRMIYDQMSSPKFVVAIGSCACSGGAFKDCFGVLGGIDAVIPVDIYVPGCSARPEVIIDGLLKLTEQDDQQSEAED